MRKLVVVVLLTICSAVHAIPKAERVLVNKSQERLYLIRDGKPFRSYHVALSPNRRSKKMAEGDERTPEGSYILDYKKEDSPFYKSIHISYPNEDDVARARRLGVEPGGAIMIHGQPQRPDWKVETAQEYNWTDGCIAVTDAEMDEIWDAVDVGTPITIVP